MINYTLLRYLLSPSLLSGIALGIAVLVVIILNAWLFVAEDPGLYAYFFGDRGIFTALVISPDTPAVYAGWLFNSTVLYFVLLGTSGVLAGMTVYAVLQGLGHLIGYLSSKAEENTMNGFAYKERIREIFKRLAIRVAVFLCWMVYVTAFITILLPFCSTLLQAGMQDASAGIPLGWLFLIGSTLLLTVGLHLHIVFARLFFLKVRIFGVMYN